MQTSVGFSDMKVTPYFNDTTAGTSVTGLSSKPEYPLWLDWEDITDDVGAPGTGNWNWTDVQNLSIEWEMTAFSGGDVRAHEAQVRVTFI